ncbi:Smr/MutS family protein [Daejeonella sp.]|uniref:Smr/MutS family protein n=1 Tax=Daejeonella sp. TaxID=2805397 RepID=UPI003983A53B
MKYKLGEFVRFVEERREGYITRIIDDQTIAVTDEDGFEIPVLASQVTRVHGKSADDEPVFENSKAVDAEFISSGILLAIVPDKKAGSVVHINLVNGTSYVLLAVLTTEKSDKFKGQFYGVITPKSAVQMYSASLNELDQWPKIHLQILFSSGNTKELKKPIEFSEKFRAKDFSGAKKTSEYLEQAAWLIQLDSDEPIIDPQKLKESFYRPAAEKLQVENPGKEIDLHIEKLRDDHQYLKNSEILDIQVAFFRKKLDAAIVHKLPSVIFIHGSGNGTLRNEICKVASKHPQVKTFMDAYREKFGYGATEVFLK